jgi:hypothetical protein
MKFLIMICLVLVFLTACDNREGEKPILTVITSTQQLYNVANHDTVNIICQMSGSNSLIANQLINVIYNPEQGLFVGSGSDNYLLTNEEGYAQGFFKVEDGYYGDITMKFSPEHFPERAKTIVLHVQDMPQIHIFSLSDSTLTYGEFTSDITLTLTSRSQNISDQWIHFSTTTGTTVDSLVARTNSLGTVHNVFHRNSYIGSAIISAYMEIYPDHVHYLYIECE